TLSIPALTRLGSVAPQWAIAIMIVGFFTIYYGYFPIFEALWNGQTPGKRYTPLCVMKDSGRPINPYDPDAPNLFRVLAPFPVFYGIAIISVFFSKQNKRLGDFVAGTVVVHEKTVEAARPFQETQVDPHATSYDVSRITGEELRLIETFLQRRDAFDPALRGSMAGQITARLSAQVGVEVRGWPYNEKFLEAVHAQYRSSNRYLARP